MFFRIICNRVTSSNKQDSSKSVVSSKTLSANETLTNEANVSHAKIMTKSKNFFFSIIGLERFRLVHHHRIFWSILIQVHQIYGFHQVSVRSPVVSCIFLISLALNTIEYIYCVCLNSIQVISIDIMRICLVRIKRMELIFILAMVMVRMLKVITIMILLP